MPEANYGVGVLLNTNTSATPYWGTTTSSIGFFGYVVCFK